MYNSIKNLYYWVGLREDCAKYIEQCETCVRESPNLPHGEYQIKNSILGSMPNDIVSGDILEYRRSVQ